jgi:tetratricopeptide (TPR) repeat protein
MNPITDKPAVVLLFSFILLLASLTPAMAEEPLPEEPLTDEHAQKIFDLAMEERDNGKVYDAIEKFEYILSRRPSLNRARLELAVSYHRANQYEKALKEFQVVLDNPDTPEKVRLAILAYLGQLTSDELKPQYENNFSYYTKAGLLYNTNINFAPLRGSAIYNVPDGQDTGSPGLDTFLSASHQYRDNKPFNTDGAATLFEWQSQVSWTGNNYTRNSDYSVNIISASTGPAFISTGRWRGAISLQVDETFFGQSVLGTFVSLNPLLTFDLGEYRGITLEASYMNNDYSQSSDLGRDGHSVLAGAAYSTLLGGLENGIETGFRVTGQTADDAQYGYNSEEIYFGGFVGAGKNSNVYLNLNFVQYDYDAADSISGTVRDEIESRYLLGYNWDISSGSLAGWTLNTYVSYTKNNSNVDFYSYDRKIFAVNLARYFL